MSANRKLQTEVVQVLKKVEEGVEIFEEIWDKVYAAGQQSLKEKYESDLKKEIKKLQRLRDQIKSWLGSSEIKDKAPLLEARKLIEGKMELFKICEKETKTKAYSKEGLARDVSSDPKEAEREEKRIWINECLQRLGDIIDAVEVELDKVSSGRAKAKNKDSIERLENRLRKNRWHIAKLEEILRLLDSGDLDPSKLDGGVKDDVEYYIESAAEDDGALAVDDEFNVYEDLQLEQLAAASLSLGGGQVGNPAAASPEADGEADPAAPTAAPDSKVSAATVPVSAPSPAVSAAPTGKDSAANTGAKKPAVVTVAGIPAIPPVANTSAAKTGPAPAVGRGAITAPVAPPAAVGAKSAGAKPTGPVTAAVAPTGAQVKGAAAAPTAASIVAASAKPTAAAVISGAANKKDKPTVKAEEKKGDKSSDEGATQTHTNIPPTSSWNSPLNAVKAEAPKNPQQQPSVLESVTPAPEPTTSILAAAPAASIPPTSTTPDVPTATTIASPSSSTLAAVQQIPVAIAANTSAPPQAARPNPQLPADALMAITMLKQSMIHTPENVDNDKHSTYAPRNPYANIHTAFPVQPPPQLENSTLFDRLPIDALFFAFYNQPGSYQQYLAAKQLKKHSWRFHKKYMTWFQRHEEPKITTEEYEEGTYVYFDYESGWCQRIKSEFKFEYAYLEDEVQPNS